MFPFFTPWKQQKTKGLKIKNQRFSGVIRKYKMGTLACNGLSNWAIQRARSSLTHFMLLVIVYTPENKKLEVFGCFQGVYKKGMVQ